MCPYRNASVPLYMEAGDKDMTWFMHINSYSVCSTYSLLVWRPVHSTALYKCKGVSPVFKD